MKTTRQTTEESLLAQYGKKFVPLEIIAADFLGITDKNTISKMAHRYDLGGIKAFRLRGKGSPWLVDIADLALTLDRRELINNRR